MEANVTCNPILPNMATEYNQPTQNKWMEVWVGGWVDVKMVNGFVSAIKKYLTQKEMAKYKNIMVSKRSIFCQNS